MKDVIMKSLLLAGIALLMVPSAFAQKEKDKADKVKTEKEDKVKAEKKDVQTIVITRTGNKDEKVTVEVQGDKITVNGKDVKDYKDGDVRIHSYTAPGYYRMNGNGDNSFTWNNGNGFSIFSEDENRAMLGVTTEGNDDGAEIQSITKESAAEKAGLKKGDVITKIDDRKIESSDDVTDAIRNHKPGDKVAITYLRDGKEQKTTTELTKWKGVRMNALAAPQIQGFEMNDLNQRFKETMPMEAYGYAFGRPKLGLSIQDTEDGVGVKVLDVDEESLAAKAGIKEGDIILGVNDTDVKGTDDVVKATRSRGEGSSYKFKIKRDNSTQTIEVKIPRKLKTTDI
jgi:serine protease Do